jgi:flavin-dependent dehydrogenase
VQTDVAIVGAGLAGSVAAQRLATAGVQVMLLEQATFPRDKPCGDGVSGRGMEILSRYGLNEWASQVPAPEVLRITSPDGQALDVRPPPGDHCCHGQTIPRRLLDARLAQAAVEAGADLVEGTRVRTVEWANTSRPSVVADGLEVTAQLVILAGGSHVPVTRRMGLGRKPPEMIAVRQYFGDTGPADRIEMHFEPDAIPGYSQVAPPDAAPNDLAAVAGVIASQKKRN